MWPLVRILAPLVALVMLLPGLGVAAAQQDPPATTPTETVPPPTDPPPVETVDTPDVTAELDTTTIVILVPAAPTPKRAAVRKHAAPPVRKNQSRAAPRVSREVAEPRRSSPRIVVADKPVKAAKAAKTRRQKPSRPKRAAPPQVSRPAVIRAPDQMPAAGVLAAQFSSPSVNPPAPASNTILYLALAFAALLWMLVALVAAAPSLVPLWPRVFAPIMQVQEQLLLAAACAVCAAITVAITWALTGPGA